MVGQMVKLRVWITEIRGIGAIPIIVNDQHRGSRFINVPRGIVKVKSIVPEGITGEILCTIKRKIGGLLYYELEIPNAFGRTDTVVVSKRSVSMVRNK